MTSTPADELRAAAAKLAPSSPAVAAHTVAVRLHPDVVNAVADLLVAVSYSHDDESLNEPGSDRHDACDRTVCAPAAALAVARALAAVSSVVWPPTTRRPDMTTDQPPTLRLLSLGAGVQSTTLLMLAAEGRLPGLDGAIFADTGWEPAAAVSAGPAPATDWCTECGHTPAVHGEGDDPVTPGTCGDCPDGEEHHDYVAAPAADRGAVDRVRALHTPDENGECQHCDRSYDPCPTIQALDAGPAADRAALRDRIAAAVQPLLMDTLPKPIAAARADEDTAALERLRRMAGETPQPEGEEVRCPLCPDAHPLHTPTEARAHFETVHPGQRLVGPGPWPLLANREQPEAEVLAAALDGLHTLIATSSRDWGQYRVDAWLWAVLVGWDCEEVHEHDEQCDDGAAMREMAERHGWDDDTVAKARRYRAAVRAVTEPAVVAQPAKEAEPPRSVCVCGHTRGEHVTVSGRLLCDACDPCDSETLTCTGYRESS